jgi:hypothetical protein
MKPSKSGARRLAIMLRRCRADRAAPSMPMKTYVATPADRERNWLLVDADGQTLGRLATQIADALRGKRKPTYTPHVDVGDFVVVVNAEKIAVTGAKLHEKIYYRHSGSRSGRSTTCSSAGRRRSSGSRCAACSRRTAWPASS